MGPCADVGITFDSYFLHAEFPVNERNALQKQLRTQNQTVVAVGSGLRLPVENTRLLEDVVNLVMSTVQPTPKLAFPTLPDEMIPTFQRLLGRLLALRATDWMEDVDE